MIRCGQPCRYSTGTPTLPNDLLNSSRSSSNVAAAAAGLAATTRSRFSDVPEMHEWNTSLSLLRTAFLVPRCPPFGRRRARAAECHARWERRARRRACPCKRCPDGRPSRTQASQSDAFACYGTTVRLPDACGPGADGQRRPCARPPSSCVCGSRASWPSYGDLADKYASLNSSTGTPKYSIDRREYIRSRQRHPAISRASPPSRTRDIPVLLAEKRCKTAFMMCTYPGATSLYRVWSTPITASQPSHGVDSSVVIHSLWINLWITMLIACKRRF